MTGLADIAAAAAEQRAAEARVEELADRVRDLVIAGHAEGLTPTQLAVAAGVSRRTVYNWIGANPR